MLGLTLRSKLGPGLLDVFLILLGSRASQSMLFSGQKAEAQDGEPTMQVYFKFLLVSYPLIVHWPK